MKDVENVEQYQTDVKMLEFFRSMDLKRLVEWIEGVYKYFDDHEIKDH